MFISISSALRKFTSISLLGAPIILVLIFMNTNITKNSFLLEDRRHKSNFFSLNISDPQWPLEPPTLRKGCKVMFKNDAMSVCHVTPWANFGDELGPPITKRILELHFGCSADDLAVFDLKNIYRGGGDSGFLNRTGSALDTCLMTVGSLWRMVLKGDHIWGTGVAYDRTILSRCTGRPRIDKVENVTIYSSRGPNSASAIKKYCSINKDALPSHYGKDIESAGDAGFLLPFIFPEHSRVLKEDREMNQSRSCIVPHKQDERNGEWGKVKNVTKKLTVDIGWENMTVALQGCDVVVSSSLHGIILAEAYGIASRRLRLSARPGDFKFDDFYTSLRGSEPQLVGNIEHAFGNMSQPIAFEERDAYAKRVLRTFPLHLFHVLDDAVEKNES